MRLNGSTVNVPVANGLRRSFLGTTPEWSLLRLHVREMSCGLGAYPDAPRSPSGVKQRWCCASLAASRKCEAQ